MSWQIRCRIVIVAILVAFGVSVHAAVTNNASVGSLGDVLVSTGNQVKVYKHDGTPKPDDTVTFGTGEIVTASAFDPGLNLFVATQQGTIVKVKKIDRSTHLVSDVVTTGLASVVTSIVFDQDGNFFLGFPGSPATAKKFVCNLDIETDTCTSFTEGATYSPLTCDASLGLWMDLAPRRPDVIDTQRMYYTCGGRAIRYFDVLAANVTSQLLVSLANPGSAKDLRLMPPRAGLDAVFGLNAVAGAIAVADDRDVKLLNSAGQIIGTFDVGSLNGWSSVEWAPLARSLWAAQNDTTGQTTTRRVYRFQLPDGNPSTPLFELPDNPSNPFVVTVEQVVIPSPSSNFTAPITSLAANGGYHSAVSTRLLLLNASTPTVIASYLGHTQWANSWQLTADTSNLSGDVRIAATLHEGGRVADVPTDFDLNRRLTQSFSTANPLYAYRGRGAVVRAVQTSTVNISDVDTLVTMDYILPELPNGTTRTVLLDDPEPVSYVGFTNDDQFTKDITREWFRTLETLRGGTKGLNDFLVASVPALQTTITAPTGLKSQKIGDPVSIRVKVNDPSSVNHCLDMVLTIARANPLPSVIVGSSETVLTTSQGLKSVFTSVSGNVCATNVVLNADISELPEEDDFQPFRTYNFCATFRSPQPGDLTPTTRTPFGDACGSFKTIPK